MIYVYYPRGAETGGPEALHQLVDSLRRQGAEAFLTPMPGFERNLRVAAYAKYDAPERFPMDGDAIVVPEICTDLLDNYPASKKYVWWLAAGVPNREDASHLAQSKFAAAEIWRAGFPPRMLSDYIPQDIARSHPNGGSIISYNGSKGAEFVEPVKSLFPNAIWVPIQGMSQTQVRNTLESSAIYLDLGHHPGKDRMPREAALRGAVVITGKRGSASLEYPDVPIQTKVNHDNPQSIANVLDFIFLDLEEHFHQQDSYRDKILNEKKVFDREAKEIFL